MRCSFWHIDERPCWICCSPRVIYIDISRYRIINKKNMEVPETRELFVIKKLTLSSGIHKSLLYRARILLAVGFYTLRPNLDKNILSGFLSRLDKIWVSDDYVLQIFFFYLIDRADIFNWYIDIRLSLFSTQSIYILYPIAKKPGICGLSKFQAVKLRKYQNHECPILLQRGILLTFQSHT